MGAPKGGNKGSFKKGNRVGGRKKLPADIREARNLSYEEMCRTVIEVRNMTVAEAKKEIVDKMPLGRRAIFNAYVGLDYKGIQTYEDRLWGKAKESIDLDVEGGAINLVLSDKFIPKCNVDNAGSKSKK